MKKGIPKLEGTTWVITGAAKANGKSRRIAPRFVAKGASRSVRPSTSPILVTLLPKASPTIP